MDVQRFFAERVPVQGDPVARPQIRVRGQWPDVGDAVVAQVQLRQAAESAEGRQVCDVVRRGVERTQFLGRFQSREVCHAATLNREPSEVPGT